MSLYKFYRKDIGKRKKEFIKVYNVIPTEIPEIFRKGTLIAYDKAIITKNPFLPKCSEIEYAEHTMTGQEEIDKMLKWQCVEITEVEYNKAVEKIKQIILNIETAYESL